MGLIPHDAYGTPGCGAPARIGSSVKCRRKKDHEGVHWAPSGEVWTEEQAEKVRQAHLDAACPVCPGCGAEYAPGDGGCFNCGDPVD